MQLKGWIRTSLIDYPDHIATVFFTGGCNFRCPMCHNADLVLRPAELPNLPEKEVWDFLERRTGVLDGVVITGGEPTLQPDLAPFLRRVRALGYDVKLDSNGYRPDVLATLLDEGLVDFIALDVKAPPEKYAHLTGMPELDVSRIECSLTLLRESGRSYELRTTVVPGLLDEDDITAIACWIAGTKQYVLQQFRGVSTLEPTLEKLAPYPVVKLQAMAKRTKPWVENTTIRGI